jgi:hypothetical protein
MHVREVAPCRREVLPAWATAPGQRQRARSAGAVLRAWATAAATLLLIGCAQLPAPRAAAGPAPYAIGLWGDLPYSARQEQVGLPNLIADMNAHGLAFTVHNGDLKQGSGSPCDDALYQRALGWFNALSGAAMFTPGDNDWADCDRASNGGFNARERLDHERQVFFATPLSLGREPLRQQVQAEPACLGYRGPVPCSENRRWQVGGVTYVTLNVTGSCNNLCDEAPDRDEYTARNAANLHWLRASFAAARQAGSVAVMLVSQANPGWDQTDPRAPRRDPRTLQQAPADRNPDGFREFLLALREEVIAFRRPVAYVHGDSHYLRIDKPFTDSRGRRLENFTRVETVGNQAEHGNNDVHWLRVLVDPASREVFAWQPMVVPGNREAVPAP